ncbi:MAG: DUF4249 domain-containing protein [Bacteroidales bacterium]|nr:DUF4249 domain-containing protein [Bacteroidales bacterium]
MKHLAISFCLSVSFCLSILLSLCLSACADDEVERLTNADMPLVVEGWIEEGEYPVVMVTRAVNLLDTIGDLEQYVEKWCRVTISDDAQSVILTGRVDKNYTPPFVYTTSAIKGQMGHTYHLKVETESQTVESDATILPYTKIDSLRVKPCLDTDTLYRLVAYLSPDQEGYYKFFSRVVNEETRYYSSFLGTFDGLTYNTSNGIDVMKGIHDTYEGHFTPYYHLGDTVRVKLCSLEPSLYAFWKAYEDAVSLSGNLFFTSTKGCPSNIPGALGYWAAYGYSARTIVIK